jgi:hypothetical protein
MQRVRSAVLVAAVAVLWNAWSAAGAEDPLIDLLCRFARAQHVENFYSCAPKGKFERWYKRWPKETAESLRGAVNRYELDRPPFEGQVRARPGDAAALKELGYFKEASPDQKARGRKMAARLIACGHAAVHASRYDEGDSGYDMAMLVYPAAQVLSVRLHVPASLLLRAQLGVERDLASKMGAKPGDVVDGGFHAVMNTRCSSAVTRAAERIVLRASRDRGLLK